MMLPGICKEGVSIPNAIVELWGKDGELITTAPADENGFVIFDSLHASDGADHYVSETFTYLFRQFANLRV